MYVPAYESQTAKKAHTQTMTELRIDYLEKGTYEDQFYAEMAKEQEGCDREFERMMRDRFGERTEHVEDFVTKDTVDD